MSRNLLTARSTLVELIRHASKYTSDREIAENFAAVTDSAASPADREALCRYRRARIAAPGFSPGAWNSNNHARVAAEFLDSLTATPSSTKDRVCPVCGASFTGRRDRLFCSGRCRQRNYVRRASASAA